MHALHAWRIRPWFARNYASGAKWFSGVVIKNVGSMMYLIRTDRGIWKRHQNQVQPRFDDVLSDVVDTLRENDSTNSENLYVQYN